MKNKVHISLVVLSFWLWVLPFSVWANSAPKGETEYISTRDSFVAGSEIILTFKTPAESIPVLFIQNSYGSTLLNGISNNKTYNFKLPNWLSQKSGQVTWILLLEQQKVLAGEFEILPKTDEKPILETYFGPRQILAGDTDFSMLVVVPTDKFDNPLPDNTAVNVSQQFRENLQLSEIKTRNLMAWQNIYSRRAIGKVLVSANCKNSNSKELTTNIYAAIPVDFEIDYKRNHPFADGNQQIEFLTSTIVDTHGNFVCDGTLVEFRIINSKGYQLKTYGKTIDGVAVAAMLHPEFSDEWKIKAYVSGLAESNELDLNFSAVTNDFPVLFDEGNRNITVGPIQSFMNQLIPDGIKVSFTISTTANSTERIVKYTSNGIASLTLSPEFYKNNTNYQIRIETLGLSKEFENVKLYEKTK